MHFTFWPCRTASEGGHTEIEWPQFLAFISSPAVAEDKNALEGWSPVRFAGNRRGRAHVEAVSAIVLDDDASGLGLGQVAALWSGIAGAVHTSHSHTDLKPKFRIVLLASRDMSADEHAIVWAHVAARAAEGGQAIDTATRDPSRLWYVPAHRAGAPYAWCELAGAPLDVDAILAAHAAPPTERPAHAVAALDRRDVAGALARPAATAPATDRRRDAIAIALGSAWPAKGRHEAQLALAGALRGEGYTEAEAVEFLCTVCRVAGDEDRAKRTATVRHTYSKAEGSALTGWTRLKALVDPVLVDAARAALGRDATWTEATNRRLAEVAGAAPGGLATGVTTASRLPPADTLQLGPIAFEIGGYDAELPPLNYQIEGLIGRGEVVMLVAHGNSLKTWLAFSMAYSIASGRPWLGRFVSTRGRAAIVDFESGRYEVLRRLKMLGVKSGEVGDRLLRTSYPPAKFIDPETWIGIAGHGLEFLAIDSFNAASPELDENDARSALMLQHAGRFAEVTSCTVIFIHHARKGAGGDKREAVRGSSALYAACDRIYAFDEPERKEGGIVVSTMRSIKDGAGRSPSCVSVELSDQGLRYVEGETKPEEDEDDRTTPERNRRLIFDLLKKNPSGLPKANLIDVMKGKRETKFELISQLLIASILVEYRDSADKKVFLMLKPGAES